VSKALTRSDEKLHSSVLDALGRDPNVPSAHVGVAVTDGLLTLAGTVRHDRDRLASLDAARRVEGVRVIVDAISVGDNATDLAADQAIAKRLVQILDATPDVPVGVTLLVRSRVVTLEGVVGTAFDRQTIRRLAGYARAVTWVRDNLVTGPLTSAASEPMPLVSDGVPLSPPEIPGSYTFRSDPCSRRPPTTSWR